MVKIVNKAYLLIGGNIGEREQVLKQARELINAYCGQIVQSSSIYETAAWGKEDQASFLNQALEIQTALSATALLEKILWVEKKLGRIREEKYGPRIIDIDILLFNDDIINEPGLKVPHPEMQNRRFVLAPLSEIEPGKMHPALKKTINELLEICPDKLEVNKITDQ